MPSRCARLRAVLDEHLLCEVIAKGILVIGNCSEANYLLWMTPSEAPKALQASECSELLDPTRANCWISAQHQPGKFALSMLNATRSNNNSFPLHCLGQNAKTKQFQKPSPYELASNRKR